jgi:hypothetical protein
METTNDALCAVCGSPITPSDVRTERAGRSIHVRCWVVDAPPAARNASASAVRRRSTAGSTT